MDSTGEQEFSQIIESSLAAILSGESTLEAVLARYPGRTQELRAELELALWLVSQQNAVSTRPGFVSASRKRLVGRIQAEARAGSNSGKRASLGLFWPRRFVLQFASALTIFILLFLSTFGAVSASQNAVPGDNLYAIKRLSEDVQYSLTVGAARRAQLSMMYSNRRLNEAEVLIVHGRNEDVAQVLEDFERHVNQSLDMLEDVENSNQIVVSDALAESVQAQLNRQTEQLTYLLQVAPPAALNGLERAVEVSTRGSQTAGEMILKEHPQTPEQSSTPPFVNTVLPGNSDNRPTRVGITPGQPDRPTPDIRATKTPRPTLERKPTNTDKPLPDAKPEKPTKEQDDGSNGVSPPVVPPGQDKKDSSDPPGLENSAKPEAPPGQVKPTKDNPSNKDQ